MTGTIKASNVLTIPNMINTFEELKTIVSSLPSESISPIRIGSGLAQSIVGQSFAAQGWVLKTASDRWEILIPSYTRGSIFMIELAANSTTVGTVKKISFT